MQAAGRTCRAQISARASAQAGSGGHWHSLAAKCWVAASVSRPGAALPVCEHEIAPGQRRTGTEGSSYVCFGGS